MANKPAVYDPGNQSVGLSWDNDALSLKRQNAS